MKGEFDNRKNGLGKETVLSRRTLIALGLFAVTVALSLMLGGEKKPSDLGTSPISTQQSIDSFYYIPRW